MEVKVINRIDIEVLTEGFKINVGGTKSDDRHADWAHHSQAFTSKKDLVKFIEQLDM